MSTAVSPRHGEFPQVDSIAVKICGIRTPEHALAVSRAGADMLGMVFAPSKRQITPEQAAGIAATLKGEQHRPLLVGVFVNESVGEMLRVARLVGLDILQLSGDESPEVAEECARHYLTIKGVRFPDSYSPEQALEAVDSYISPGVRLLLDSYRPGEYGGTGERASTSLAFTIARHVPLILAGGLNPGNVSEAIASVHPWAVDVSSGVERDGVKDNGLIEAFVREARAAVTEKHVD